MADLDALICAFKISADGVASVAGEDETCAPGEYLWLHYDLNAADTRKRLKQRVKGISRDALNQVETRPRCDRLGDGLILNLRGVNLNPGADPEDMVSLRMWVEHNRIISTRFRKAWAEDQLRQGMAQGTGPLGVGGFLHALTEGLTRRIESVSLELDEEVDALEEDIMLNGETNAQGLATTRASLIKLRRFIGPQRDALTKLATSDVGFLTEGNRIGLREAANCAIRTVESLDAGRERLAALQDYLTATEASTQGRHSAILSVVAAIFLPLTFLTGLFGVNIGGMPMMESAWGFWSLSIASALLAVGLLVLFKKMKWL